MKPLRYDKTLYYKYPATWVMIYLFNSEKLFYFHLKIFWKQKKWFASIQTPIFHLQKDNCNLVFGPSFLRWQFSLHFHW